MRRIVFFDSGAGGLSICEAVMRACPELGAAYLFDNEFFPYSERSDEVIIERTGLLLGRICAQFAFDAVVVACNTASTLVLPMLRSRLSMPVVGVVPAIKPAAQLSQRHHICLLATRATIARPYINDLIRNFAAGCRVMRIGSTRLVEIAENKLRGGHPDPAEMRTILSAVREGPAAERPDVLVLGCTHFAFLRREIQEAAGPGFRLLDAGDAIARRVRSLLQAAPPPPPGRDALPDPAGQVFCTSPPADAEAALDIFRPYGFHRLSVLS